MNLGFYNLPKYCSSNCANQARKERNRLTNYKESEEHKKLRLEKIKATNRAKLGVDFPFQSQDIQEQAHANMNYQKRNETMIKTLQEQYGPNITNISQVKAIKDKKKETLAKNYGSVDAAYKHIFEEVEKTNIELYGVDNVLKSLEFHKESLNQSWENTVKAWSEYIIPMFNRENWKGYYQGYIYKWKCVKCGHEFESEIYHSKHLCRNGKLSLCPRCPHCYPPNPNRSALEINIYNYICEIYKEIYPNADIEKEVLHNQYNIIPPKELDIYIPSLNLAFEVDGTYWHSEKFHDVAYHEDKDNRCAELGIKLFHIKEEDWESSEIEVKNKLYELMK